MKALVTGGAGFIGSHICSELIRRGVQTIVLDDLSKGRAENVPQGAQLVKGSVTDAEVLTATIKGVDVVFHFAARVSARESLLTFHEDATTNIIGTLDIISCCRDNGVGRIIYSSSAAVYEDPPAPVPMSEDSPIGPQTPYGISKLSGEMYVTTICPMFDLDYVVLRNFNVYGPGQIPDPYTGVVSIFVKNLLTGEPPVIFGNGEQVRDFVFIDDVVRASMLAMEADSVNFVVNIATGVPHSIKSLTRIILDVMGSDLEPIYENAVEGDMLCSLADTTRAREVLNFTAEGQLEEKVETIINWLKPRL